MVRVMMYREMLEGGIDATLIADTVEDLLRVIDATSFFDWKRVSIQPYYYMHPKAEAHWHALDGFVVRIFAPDRIWVLVGRDVLSTPDISSIAGLLEAVQGIVPQYNPYDSEIQFHLKTEYQGFGKKQIRKKSNK